MKLGPWFNGKNHHTMNKNTSLVFPTAVYLENLEKSKKSESRDKRSDEEEIIAATSATGSEAGEASLSSFDNIRDELECFCDGTLRVLGQWECTVFRSHSLIFNAKI